MMKINQNFLPFAVPEIGEEEISEVVHALRSGWVTTGPKTRQFEADFSAYLGGGIESVAVNSATSGLHLALEALGVGPGDEVITTTHTFTATAEVIRYLGATPIFVDVKPDTLNIDADLVRANVTSRTKVIIPVHYAGLSADMASIAAVAREYGIAIVEDAAHAFPTTYQGRLIGTLESDITVFSFYANKTMTTGEGGMFVTRDPKLAARARTMRLHGINRDAFDRFTATVPSWYYEVVAPGFKYNLTDLAAALGIHQLRKAETFRRRRETIAQVYHRELADLPLRLPADAPVGELHSWHLYVVRLGDEVPISRDRFIQRLYELGVGCSVHYIPLHLQPYWRETFSLRTEMFPESQRAYERMVSLPIYSKMSDVDIAHVVESVRTALR
jgi:dTDP-4-amino-4,6-dideoxygalactose transaminase